MNSRTISVWLVSVLVIGGFSGVLIPIDQVGGAGPTYVSGSINSDTTWFVTDSPYIVMGDITVEPGFTLTIEPGVEVKFDGTYSIIVDGRLIAKGTSSNNIKFTSNKTSPAKGDWYTIRLRTDYNQIDNIEVEYATYGVFMTLFGTYNTIINTTVTNSKFDGIYITNSDNNLISNCSITSNDRFGITIYESYGTRVENSTIQYNNFFGINLNASTFTEIYDTNISYNDGKGILLYSNSHNTTISGCEVDWNNHIGIDLWGSSDNEVINTTVIGNKGIGIDFGRVSRNQLIENCTITDNEDTGVDLKGSNNTDIIGCNVSRNKGKGGIYSGDPIGFLNITNTKVLNNSLGNGIDLYMTRWVNITDSHIAGNVGNGIYFNKSEFHLNNKIKNCTIFENELNGMYFYAYNYSGPTYIQNNNIVSNKIYSNGQQGIYLQTGTRNRIGYIQFNSIHSNTIHSNNQSGIYFYSYDHDYAYVQNNNIYSNDIYSNSQNGLYFLARYLGIYYAQNNNIYSNSIYSNGYNGIFFDGYKGNLLQYYIIQNNDIHSNMIFSNGHNGISFYIFTTSSSTVENNNIHSNTISNHVGGDSSFGNALDNNGLRFTTGGDANWEVDKSTFYFDGESAKSGNLSYEQESHIETVILGPGTIKFYWKRSGEAGSHIKFIVDGVQKVGCWSNNWEQRIHDISPGFHTVKWSYVTSDDPQYILGNGWLDKIEYNGQSLNSGIFLHVVNPSSTWQDSDIYNNTITSNGHGIVLSNMKSQIIYANNISENDEGILLEQSSSNTIRYNNITYNNETGVNLTRSSNNNLVRNNNISSNKNNGLSITDNSNDNTIFRNNISYNAEVGLNITDASGNKIHHNNFVNNLQNAYDSTIALNEWDDGAEGNYWWDYLGSDDDNDGFGEDPYVIPGGGSRDWHPFIVYVNVTPPYILFTTPTDGEVNVAVDTTISIYFSKEMNKTAVESAISISGGLTPTSFVWDGANKNVTFTPSSILDMATVYTVTITTDAKDTQGNPIKISYIFSFRTLDVDPPEILETSPYNGFTNVDRNAPVVVTFNESMQPSSVTFSCSPNPWGWSVSWNDNNTIATFSHNKFGNEATYTFNITAGKDLAGLDLVPGPVPNPWWFSTPDTVGPEITGTSPINDVKNVSITADIVVNFNEEIDIASVTYVCTPDPFGWSVIWTNNNKTATFSHNDFNERTLYTFHVTGAKDIFGNDLNPGPAPNPWSFTTTGDYTQPVITLTSPANNTVDVDLNADVIVTFNEAMDNLSLSFICIPDPGGWSESWNPGNTIVTFTHNPFENGTTYTFHINTARDIAGNNLVQGSAPNPWSFTTVGDMVAPEIISTSPVNNEVDMPQNVDIIVIFNEPMDPLSLDYVCTPDPGGWSETWSNGDMVVTLSHDLFEIKTTYIFQITGAKDISGNDLTSGAVPNPWSFITADDIIGPQIILTSPANDEVDVDPSIDIVVIFNEVMDNSSLNYICIPDPGGWSESWSNGDTVVTFTHNSLAYGTIINFYVIAGKDISGNDLESGPVANPWSFTTSGDLEAPQVSLTSPADKEIDVEQDAIIEVTFSEPMNTTSINFICTPDPGGWSANWSNADTVISFSHDPFAYETLYDFYIIGGKDLSGNDLDSGSVPNPWSFTTIGELVAPQIISTNPIENEKNVDFDRNIIVTFSETMDTTSITYICTPDPGGWFVGWSNGDKVFTLSHNPFSIDTEYSFQITSAKDISGNELAEGPVSNPWSFSTQWDRVTPKTNSTSPFDGEENVNLGAYIFVEFTEAMDVSTIEYECSPDPGGWFENWNSENTVLTLVHNPLEIETTYTFQITSGKDLAGNNLTSGTAPLLWDFTTIAVDSLIITPPEVTIAVNGTVVLIAWAYDSEGTPISDISFTWGTNNNLGTVSPQGKQAVTFQASSNTGVCTVNVTVGSLSANSVITIETDEIVVPEPEDEEPPDLLWLWFLILVIGILSLINFWVAIRKQKPEPQEEPVEDEKPDIEENQEFEESLEDTEEEPLSEDIEEAIEENTREFPPPPPPQ